MAQVEDRTAEELMQSISSEAVEWWPDKAVLSEILAQLRERNAARKVAHDYQMQQQKVRIDSYWAGIHLEEAMDAARKVEHA
jgi:hypothetical protein